MTNSRSTLSLLLPVIIGSMLGGLSLYYLNDKDEKLDLEKLALGDETSSQFSQFMGVPVHCEDIDDAYQCIDGYKKYSNNNVILWLGNSQLHSINQMKAGDETASSILHRCMKSYSKYNMTFSQPNAGLQEHYVLFEYISRQLPISTLVLPVVFDDMRETGIRSSLLGIFSDLYVVDQLKVSEIGKLLLKNNGDKDSAGNDIAALDKTVQENSERYLNEKLKSFWQIWADRPALRGRLFVSLYKLRNWAFGINPSSTRKMMPARYTMNLQALEAILTSAIEKDIEVLLYIVPLRSDVKVPYDLVQYNKFKVKIRDVAQKFDVKFKNYEKLVPTKNWGTKESTTLNGDQEIDFMHFQAGGHKLLASALCKELKDIDRAERRK